MGLVRGYKCRAGQLWHYPLVQEGAVKEYVRYHHYAKRRPKVQRNPNGCYGDGAHPPKLCLQGPPVNRPVKSMTKTLPQSGYLSLISVSIVASSLSACAVVTKSWSLFGPPKVHAVTEKTVGKYSSKVTEVPVGSKRRILEPRHLWRNQYSPRLRMESS